MAMFDDAMKNAVPGGNLATPIAVVVGALLLGKFFGGSSAPTAAPGPARSAPPPSLPTNVPPGSVLGGLGDLIGKLTAGGAGPQVNSWVGPGANPNSFYFGVLPVVAEVGGQKVQFAQAALLGQMTTGFPVSPLTPATFLVVGLCGIELADHQRFSIPFLFGTSVMMTIACVALGVFPL